ncbi:hypothetical protein NIES2134_109410 [Thermostichus vulcanus NIES-2134]|nr:hypothetical protein NIES2134_109410 [Thermostichus vulcanus NIES-2134]
MNPIVAAGVLANYAPCTANVGDAALLVPLAGVALQGWLRFPAHIDAIVLITAAGVLASDAPALPK